MYYNSMALLLIKLTTNKKPKVVRFVDKAKTIQQRVLALSFLDEPLTGRSLAAQVIKQLMTLAHQDPLKLRFNTVDGCSTNGVANIVMNTIFTECCDLVCVSHTSNLPMKLFEKATATAHSFLQSWSQCLTQGSKPRDRYCRCSIQHPLL